MRIGFDAYFLHNQGNTGIGNFLLNILLELSNADKQNEYFIYTPEIFHKDVAEKIFTNKKFNKRIVNSSIFKQRRLWLQSPQLLSKIKKDKLDIFFGGGEYIPVFLPSSVIAISAIHDVVFKIFPETTSITNKIFYKTLFKISLKRSNYIATISNNSKKEIIKYLNCPAEKIFVIHNTIDTKKYIPKKSVTKKDYILFVGTLQPRKNLVNLILAFAKASFKTTDQLVIVGGSGWKNSKLATVIESLSVDIKNRIIFKGFISGDELITLYQEAKMVVVPSLHEGFGLVIAEAMASGTAVITSPVAAIPEVFSDTPIYANPLSIDDLSTAMLKLSMDKKMRIKTEKNGLAFIDKYSNKTLAKNFIDMFNTVIGKK